MPFACIFVSNFPVAAVFRAEPELRARAVAIFEGKPPLEKVFAVNDNAGRAGIAPGMTKAQAELCSELTLHPRSLLQESAAHAALLDCAQSFSPCVEDAAADTAILDLAGMESLFGTMLEMRHHAVGIISVVPFRADSRRCLRLEQSGRNRRTCCHRSNVRKTDWEIMGS